MLKFVIKIFIIEFILYYKYKIFFKGDYDD